MEERKGGFYINHTEYNNTEMDEMDEMDELDEIETPHIDKESQDEMNKILSDSEK